jgi:hypothetical protein
MSERRCNECTLCCRLMPVAEFHKAANVRCSYQRAGKGCLLHEDASYPRSCSLWSCVWLTGAEGLARPDRSHLVVDPMPDFIEMNTAKIPVLQVWCDPKFPNAHREPSFRAWLAEYCERMQLAVLVRFDSAKALALFPPGLCEDGQWHEKEGVSSAPHSAGEVLHVTAAARAHRDAHR